MAFYPGAQNTQLAPSQIMTYLYNAGFRGVQLVTMTAVILGESGGNTAAFNPTDPNGGSVGIAQINGIHFQDGSTTLQCALDPQCSANYAYQLYQASGFNPWGSYTDGRYQQYTQQAQQAYTNFSPSGSGTVPGMNQPTNSTTGNPFSAITGLFSGAQGVSAWLSPVRLLKFAVGFFLVAVVVYMILTDKVAPVVEKAVGAFPQGEAGDVVSKSATPKEAF